MNRRVIFLFIATAILLFSIICVSVAPIINNILDKFGDWGKGNCRYYADKAKYTKYLDEKDKNERLRNLCYRQNAMHGLEYSSFIIDLAIGFICAQLALMHYFKIGASFEKYTGLIGLIGGAIGFILTLVYVCFSGYIFNNDAAFKDFNGCHGQCIQKLYSNGAIYKDLDKDISINKKLITIYAYDKSYDSEYIKYKDLGQIQYNYNKKYYETYHKTTTSLDCNNDSPTKSNTGCEYYYKIPAENNENKYLYDRWCLSLVLAVFITALNIALLIFGFLIFKNEGGSDEVQEIKMEEN